MNYDLAMKKNGTLPLSTTWMDLEKHREGQILYESINTWTLMNKINEQTKQKQTRGHSEQTDGGQVGGR